LKVYTTATKNEAKLLYIEKEMTFNGISNYFGGKPSKQTIKNWSDKKDKYGKTWGDYRAERAEHKYVELSPQNMASKILEKLWSLLNDPAIDPGKLPDALAKMQKGLKDLTDPKYQIPVMYQMLQDYILYCKKQHHELVTEEFLESVRAYKNHIRARLDNDYS